MPTVPGRRSSALPANRDQAGTVGPSVRLFQLDGMHRAQSPT